MVSFDFDPNLPFPGYQCPCCDTRYLGEHALKRHVQQRHIVDGIPQFWDYLFEIDNPNDDQTDRTEVILELLLVSPRDCIPAEMLMIEPNREGQSKCKKGKFERLLNPDGTVVLGPNNEELFHVPGLPRSRIGSTIKQSILERLHFSHPTMKLSHITDRQKVPIEKTSYGQRRSRYRDDRRQKGFAIRSMVMKAKSKVDMTALKFFDVLNQDQWDHNTVARVVAVRHTLSASDLKARENWTQEQWDAEALPDLRNNVVYLPPPPDKHPNEAWEPDAMWQFERSSPYRYDPFTNHIFKILCRGRAQAKLSNKHWSELTNEELQLGTYALEKGRFVLIPKESKQAQGDEQASPARDSDIQHETLGTLPGPRKYYEFKCAEMVKILQDRNIHAKANAPKPDLAAMLVESDQSRERDGLSPFPVPAPEPRKRMTKRKDAPITSNENRLDEQSGSTSLGRRRRRVGSFNQSAMMNDPQHSGISGREEYQGRAPRVQARAHRHLEYMSLEEQNAFVGAGQEFDRELERITTGSAPTSTPPLLTTRPPSDLHGFGHSPSLQVHASPPNGYITAQASGFSGQVGQFPSQAVFGPRPRVFERENGYFHSENPHFDRGMSSGSYENANPPVPGNPFPSHVQHTDFNNENTDVSLFGARPPRHLQDSNHHESMANGSHADQYWALTRAPVMDRPQNSGINHGFDQGAPDTQLGGYQTSKEAHLQTSFAPRDHVTGLLTQTSLQNPIFPEEEFSVPSSLSFHGGIDMAGGSHIPNPGMRQHEPRLAGQVLEDGQISGGNYAGMDDNWRSVQTEEVQSFVEQLLGPVQTSSSWMDLVPAVPGESLQLSNYGEDVEYGSPSGGPFPTQSTPADIQESAYGSHPQSRI